MRNLLRTFILALCLAGAAQMAIPTAAVAQDGDIGGGDDGGVVSVFKKAASRSDWAGTSTLRSIRNRWLTFTRPASPGSTISFPPGENNSSPTSSAIERPCPIRPSPKC